MSKKNGQIKEKKDIIAFKPMQAGEFEARKAFEETTTHNVRLCVAHANDTRVIVRELEEKITNLQNTILSKTTQIEQMQKQIAGLLQDKYKSGS